MERRERNAILRKKIPGEIADIEAFTAGMRDVDFYASKLAQKAVMMSLINIGELSKSFTPEYLEATKCDPLAGDSRAAQHRRPPLRGHPASQHLADHPTGRSRAQARAAGASRLNCRTSCGSFFHPPSNLPPPPRI